MEETDRAGGLLSHESRRRATAAARRRGAPESGWLAERAQLLVEELSSEFAFLKRLLHWSHPVQGLLAPAVVISLLLGLATNALGPERRIHVLAVPLLGIIAWNLAILALITIRRRLPLGAGAWRFETPKLLAWWQTLVRRLVRRLPDHPPRRQPPSGRSVESDRRAVESDRRAVESELLRRALARFIEDWFPVAAPLAAARVRRLLHASALALVVGVLAGMYVRGIAFEYRATWESTFLSGELIDRVLGIILAPAAWLLGTAVPSAAAIERPGSGDAAPWIHLYAVTTAFYVGLPRGLLTAFESVRCRRLQRRLRLTLPALYPRRLVAAVETSATEVEIVPYSYRPVARAVETLRTLVRDLFGPRAEIRVRSPVEYGTEPVEPGGGRCRMFVFGLAQTPEAEVHGKLLAALREGLADGQLMVVVVDGSVYRQRVGPERLEERRRTWNRVLAATGLEAVHLDLLAVEADTAPARLVAGVWPPGGLDEPLEGE
ncbi:MAG: DUF2868 domain-containing protein [bacterium]|nr:DUF2868 domain-containing protein [bacterium]